MLPPRNQSHQTKIKYKLTFALLASLTSTGFADFKAPLPEFKNEKQLAEWRAEKASESTSQGYATEETAFFTGRPYLVSSGGYAFKYRGYNPELARWTTEDPSGFPDGPNSHRYAPVPTGQLDFLGLLTLNWSTSNEVTSGETTARINTLVEPTGNASGDHCYIYKINKGYSFSLTGTVLLPRIGATWTLGANTSTFDSVFHDSTEIHENWHNIQIDNMAAKTWGALEDWSASYVSNEFRSQAEAEQAWATDKRNAYTLANDVYTNFKLRGGNHEGGGGTGYNFNYAAGTFRSIYPDWGQSFNNTISAYTIQFTKTPGTCE